MRQALKESILDMKSMNCSVGGDDLAYVAIHERNVLIVLNAIPAALSISAAKEMIGRPFLRDHEFVVEMEEQSAVGPIHLIACHKQVTEAQALNLLGFPDTTIVSAPFGVYVADNTQKIQFCLISNCRDEYSTRVNVSKFFDWLDQTKEDSNLTSRAASRKKIAEVILKERESQGFEV